MDKGIPPEERLLRLIRGKRSSDKKQDIIKPGKKKIVSSNFKPINDFLQDKVSPFFNFKFLNIFLISLLVIFFVYSVFKLFFPLEGRIKKISESVENSVKKDKEDLQISNFKDYEYYNKQFTKRDIFNAPAIETSPGEAPVNTQQAVSNFKLVGIVLDKQPQAVLENTTTKETYFLNKGDRIDRIQIKEILESKVIIMYAGEEIELDI